MPERWRWRLSAWLIACVESLVYVILFPMNVPRWFDSAGQFGYRLGYILALMIIAFVPIWLARVLYNRIPAA